MKVHPFQAKNIAEAESRFIAQEAFVAILLTDPRIERVYHDWRRTSGLAALLKQAQLDQAEFLLCYYAAGIILRRVLLPPVLATLPDYNWLPERLAVALMVHMANEAAPNSLRAATGILLPPLSRPTRGRRAKAGGESIWRDVEWFYRVRVQEPSETPSALGRAYAKEHDAGRKRADRWSQNTRGRSAVELGIKRAMYLLETPPPK